MSKYWPFVNMKSCIIFIILGFTSFGICSDLSNATYDDYSVCPINFLRKKRALEEYTRWRTNIETTSEFIVKVLDDELTTRNSRQIVAINIQPVTKRGEKIVVGGVMVHTTKTSAPLSDSRDYTRFVPPTTVPASPVGEESHLASAPINRALGKIKPYMRPKERYSHRDESPPASPQFLTRTSTLLPRQFAPIAPVAFARKPTMSPIKPLTSASHYTIEEFPPTRTTSITHVNWPTRTDSRTVDEYIILKKLLQNVHESVYDITRSTLRTENTATRTSTTDLPFDEESENRFSSYDENRRFDDEKRKKAEKTMKKDPDDLYDMAFYSDEDVESTRKKSERQNENYDNVDITSENRKVTRTHVTNVRASRSTTDVDYSHEDHTNTTQKTKFKKVIGYVTRDISKQAIPQNKFRDKEKQICNLLKLRQLSFNSPRTLHEIESQLKQWAETSPVTKWEDITNGNLTNMENPIYMMIIDDPSTGQIVSAKQTVMIVAGIQGRDHHAVAAAMYVLYQLIERSDAHSDLLTKYRFWIIPVFNPDGYDYSMTFPHRREWSKNLRQNWDYCKSRESCISCEMNGLRCNVQTCYGVNLDRNFEYQWIPAEELRAEHPCGALYAGRRQLSEGETWALTSFLHEQASTLATFIAFKEGEVLGVMYPYSHTRKLRALDHLYRKRASRAASAASSISGRPYVAGQTSEFLPLYAGGVEDWVDGHLGIDSTYTIMMYRPADSYNAKLIPERVVHEAYAAMDTLLLQSVEPLSPSPVLLKKINSAPKPHLHCFFVSLMVFMNIFLSRFINTLLIIE